MGRLCEAPAGPFRGWSAEAPGLPNQIWNHHIHQALGQGCMQKTGLLNQSCTLPQCMSAPPLGFTKESCRWMMTFSFCWSITDLRRTVKYLYRQPYAADIYNLPSLSNYPDLWNWCVYLACPSQGRAVIALSRGWRWNPVASPSMQDNGFLWWRFGPSKHN